MAKAFLIKGPQQFCTELWLYDNQQEKKNKEKKKSDELNLYHKVFENLSRPRFMAALFNESLHQGKDYLTSLERDKAGFLRPVGSLLVGLVSATSAV